MKPTTLAAERARFRAKLEAEALRQRARRILAGRWNASPAELLAAVQEAHPELSRPEMDALVCEARAVQLGEAPVHLPVESTPVRPLETEPRLTIDPRASEKWARFLDGQMRTRPKVRKAREG